MPPLCLFSHPLRACSRAFSGVYLRACLAIFLSVCALPALADSWTGPDKEKHLLGSAAVAFVVTHATDNPTTGFWSAVAVGGAKEVYDHYHRGGDASARDLVWDVAGAYLGAQAGGWTIKRSGGTTTVAYAWRF